MRITSIPDPFLENQPEITFTKDLSSPVHTSKPPRWNTVSAGEGEVDFSKVNLKIDFEDELLETAYDDFKRFLEISDIGLCEEGTTIKVTKGETECFEAYKILVDQSGCTIVAADTEGIRRALVFVEDEMLRREASVLKIGEIKRKPHITARVSRCYFTAASCTANEEKENELCDDIDYYPDEYLNRLAHDGINALWLGATMRFLVKHPLIPEYGKDADKRIAKLKEVVAKCKRYGIKIYLFGIDPASSYQNPDFLNHPEMHNDSNTGKLKFVCPSTESGYRYMREAIQSIFRSVPDLAGFINLSAGESMSHCASSGLLTCKRCIENYGTMGKTLAAVEKILADAIFEVNPNAEYISWTYAQRGWPKADTIESCNCRDKKVKHLANFEDHTRVNQLGKDRIATDYWLSFAGPGQLFETCLDINKKRGIDTWAKIQVCSSHEISTVPYVPVPALLYEKYKYMYENQIHGVMQCWFFGNYPCLMNKAAGELAFEPFFQSKEEFLTHLAGIYWGRDAKTVAKAWDLFTEGYKNFPVGVMFEWYGPMQDSPVAPLHLKPVDRTLASTWLLKEMSGGDRIGDCLLNSHTIDEAVTLTNEMIKLWGEGFDTLSALDCFDNKNRTEQINIAKAIGLIFESGRDTFRFYELRRKLGIGEGDPKQVLDEMRKIVEREIEISSLLIPLCQEDNRIGYHSEAHGFKLFPKKLKWRIEKLHELLSTEFVEVEERIDKGLTPLEYYYGKEPDSRVYEIKSSDINNAPWLPFVDANGDQTQNTLVRIASKDGRHTIQFCIKGGGAILLQPEFSMFFLKAPMTFENGKMSIKLSKNANSYGLFEEGYDEWISKFEVNYQKEGEKEYYTLSYRAEEVGSTEKEPFRFIAKRSGTYTEATAKAEKIIPCLGIGPIAPEQFLFVIPR